MTEEMQNLWITTWGRNPKFPEIEFTENNFIKKFGYEKTKQIFKKAVLEGFKKLTTLWDSLDEQGNIKPKEWKQRIDNSTYKPVIKKEEQLCYCGCGRKPSMRVDRYSVAEYGCYERIKKQNKEVAQSLSDVIKTLDLEQE